LIKENYSRLKESDFVELMIIRTMALNKRILVYVLGERILYYKKIPISL
jgi:hypothetical protein